MNLAAKVALSFLGLVSVYIHFHLSMGLAEQTDRQTDRAIEGFIFTIPYSLFSMEFFMTDVGIVEVFAKESELPFIAF